MMGARLDTPSARATFMGAFGRRVVNESGTKSFTAIFRAERVIAVEGAAAYSGSSTEATLLVGDGAPDLDDYERLAVAGEKWWRVSPSPSVVHDSGFLEYRLIPD